MDAIRKYQAEEAERLSTALRQICVVTAIVGGVLFLAFASLAVSVSGHWMVITLALAAIFFAFAGLILVMWVQVRLAEIAWIGSRCGKRSSTSGAKRLPGWAVRLGFLGLIAFFSGGLVIMIWSVVCLAGGPPCPSPKVEILIAVGAFLIGVPVSVCLRWVSTGAVYLMGAFFCAWVVLGVMGIYGDDAIPDRFPDGLETWARAYLAIGAAYLSAAAARLWPN